jgi:hypothetical protein
MPYSGYISASIRSYGTQQDTLDDCLFLIVPNNNYNARVPVLIGTNIISRLMDIAYDEFGSRYICKMLIYIPHGI